MRQNEQLIQTRTFHTEKGRTFVKVDFEFMLNNLFDNEWGSVWGSSDAEGREEGRKDFTSQSWVGLGGHSKEFEQM